MKQFNVYLGDELRKAAAKKAKETDSSLARIIRRLLILWLEGKVDCA